MTREEEPRILLGHGDGGRLTHDLIRSVFLPHFDNPANPVLRPLPDAAVLAPPAGWRLAFTTDSFVVSPAFFPGGNIGTLAVTGTVNDLAVSGARPAYLSVAFILEEGYPLRQLEAVVESMALAARDAGVQIVTGDTKVVEHGAADGIYINTAGIGWVPEDLHWGLDAVRPGDVVLLSGPPGAHGMAVLLSRGDLGFQSPIRSDCASVFPLVQALQGVPGIRFMRDPTRGGVATVLNEVAQGSGLDVWVEEAALPEDPAVSAAARLLGVDPLYLACEGRVVAICAPDAAAAVLDAWRAVPGGLGRDAAAIGHVSASRRLPLGPRPEPAVYLRTALGGTRLLDVKSGGELPRIC